MRHFGGFSNNVSKPENQDFLTFQSNQTSKQKLGDIFTFLEVFSLDDSKNAHIHQKAKENDNSLLKENTDNNGTTLPEAT